MTLNDLLDTPPWEWPEEAADVILETLTDKHTNAADRRAAAEMASEQVVMNDELAEALLSIIGDASEPEALRGRAAIGLGPTLELGDIELMETDHFDDPESVPVSFATFQNVVDSLHRFFLDERNPKEVRRRILEGSVRAPQEWHKTAIRTAYSSGDREWVLTAVFSMRWVRGFDSEILESLKSPDTDIAAEAVSAAGTWQLDAAWPHVVELVTDPATPKPLLLAAIEALANLRPKEAGPILVELTDSDDEEIAESANDAMMMANTMSGEGGYDEDSGEWLN